MNLLELRVNITEKDKQFCNVAAYSEGSAQEYSDILWPSATFCESAC